MAIPRVRADETHRVVYAGDPDVRPRNPKARGWIPAPAARVASGADIVEVHPLNATDCRRAQGALIRIGDTRVDLGDKDEALIRAAVAAVNDLRGEEAVTEALRFPSSAVRDLASYIEGISDPVAALVAEEVPLPAALKSDGADRGGDDL